jgi:hypothetical protein
MSLMRVVGGHRPISIEMVEPISYGFQQYKPGVRASVVLFD